MTQVHLIAHITINVQDADAMAWETPESCTPTAVRRLLKELLQKRFIVSVPQTPAVGVIDLDALRVEWPGDHALRVLSQVRQGLYSAQELGLGALDAAPKGRVRLRLRREPGG